MQSTRMIRCTECSSFVEAGEFHPYAFCVWVKAGLHPWAQLVSLNRQLGIDVTHWPNCPPLVKDLREGKG